MGSTAEFFKVQPIETALKIVFEHWQITPKVESCPTTQALGRIIAVAPLAPVDLPTFPRSSMDGYAVKAADTFGASQTLPAYLKLVEKIPMGAVPQYPLEQGQAAEIYTGAMLPQGADAVVMVERTQAIDEQEVEILAPVAVGENVVQIGEDVAQGSPVLPVGQTIRPQDIGGLLALGLLEIQVARPPRVAILGSGDELVPPEQEPRLGQIRDINSYTLAALVRQMGGEPLLLGIAQDNPTALYALARQAIEQADIVVLTAGSSVSTRDLTRETIEKLGQPGILQHGVAVKPGKPTILAVCENKPVLGLAGNPVSAFLMARQILVPLIQRFLGKTPTIPALISATLTANISSTTGREDTIPVKLHPTPSGWEAEPIFGKSNLIFTLIQADGLVVVPLNSNGIKAGTSVEVYLFG